MLERFNHLLHYSNEKHECRSRIIEQYFCDSMSEPCGICDNCLARKKQEKSSTIDYEKHILELLTNESLTIKELVSRIVGNEKDILNSVRQLLESGKLKTENGKVFVL